MLYVVLTHQQSVFKQYHMISRRFTYKMTAKNGGQTYETKLRHCHAMFSYYHAGIASL